MEISRLLSFEVVLCRRSLRLKFCDVDRGAFAFFGVSKISVESGWICGLSLNEELGLEPHNPSIAPDFDRCFFRVPGYKQINRHNRVSYGKEGEKLSGNHIFREQIRCMLLKTIRSSTKREQRPLGLMCR